MRQSRSRRVLAALTVALLVGLAVALTSQAAAIHTQLVTKNSNAHKANGESSTEGATLLSANGNIAAFTSEAGNLPGGDGVTEQVYARDIHKGTTKLMSAKANGDPVEGAVGSPAVSGNGRFVAFQGFGDGLPGSGGNISQVWVRDRETGHTKLVSQNNGGDPGDHGSSNPALSGDGRFIVFESSASNLPGGNGADDFVYVRDTKRKKTFEVSRTSDNQPATATVYGQLISADGRFVVFESDDADLPQGDGSTRHSYLRDRKKHTTRLIDRNSADEPADDDGQNPSMSPRGRFVAFTSRATNLPGENGSVQVYLRDLKHGTTRLISADNQGNPGDTSASDPRVSADGRLVAFDGDASNLPGADGNDYQEYVRNTHTGKTRLVSRAPNGDIGADDSGYGSISANGRWVAFDSDADNLGGNPLFSNLFRAGPLR